MNIKAVCEFTGLNKKTVLCYIDEGLIAPKFSENYLAQKKYNFSKQDIDMIINVATLRKLDFSFDETHYIMSFPEKSKSIVENVKDRVKENTEFFNALSQFDNDDQVTVLQLAKVLSPLAKNLPAKEDFTEQNKTKVVLIAIKNVLVCLLVWVPIVLLVLNSLNPEPLYPTYGLADFLIALVLFLPTILLLVISKFNFSFKKTIRRILIFICILSFPITLMGSLVFWSGPSMTTDIDNYYEFDPECYINTNMDFHEFFPKWPNRFETIEQPDGSLETVYLDTKYYYYYTYGFDYTYDVHAEWPLDDIHFKEETDRVNELFNEKANESAYKRFIQFKKGDFECLILYKGDEPFNEITEESKPYEYYIFGYNEKENIVRYICCVSSGYNQPYYLELEW